MALCVCHMSVFYRNGWMNRASFWQGNFLTPILPCVKKKFAYFQNKGNFFWYFVQNLYRSSKNWKIVKNWTVERRSSEVLSTKLTSELRCLTTSSSQVIVNLCLRHDFVAWVNWWHWQLIPVLPSSLTQSVIHVPWSVNAMKVITDVSVIHIVHTVSYSEFYLDFQISKRVCVYVCFKFLL